MSSISKIMGISVIVCCFNSARFFDIRLDLYFFERSDNLPPSQGIHECMQYKINNGLLAEDIVVIKDAWSKTSHKVKQNESSPITKYTFTPWLLKDIPLPVKFRQEMSLVKNFFEKWEFFNMNSYSNRYINSAISSLSVLSYISSKIGFQNIYFIGTDLVNSCHFYLVPNSIPEGLKSYRSKLHYEVRKVHGTLDRKVDVVSLLNFTLKMLQQKHPYLKFWSPHQTSPLSEVFPVQDKLVKYSKTAKKDLIKLCKNVEQKN